MWYFFPSSLLGMFPYNLCLCRCNAFACVGSARIRRGRSCRFNVYCKMQDRTSARTGLGPTLALRTKKKHVSPACLSASTIPWSAWRGQTLRSRWVLRMVIMRSSTAGSEPDPDPDPDPEFSRAGVGAESGWVF
ncbi:uncharacterized protein CC84DRAFT_760782 [Paraphaeosphaeria sporulosa]|uniref:Secreted protein n=1 Tax=Paraphaeosphaeria sporulosa TaxID=1460663 RepID=A0A177CHJ1_9PLEO|nr:uncharacterized protein CC84DRAFT_760782 [Paraphaeosphaeria sporulosa]OAG06319.1 hypothetical protein CC84DRAFT_760782 [Paraphaeosphaeria sporulosa]